MGRRATVLPTNKQTPSPYFSFTITFWAYNNPYVIWWTLSLSWHFHWIQRISIQGSVIIAQLWWLHLFVDWRTISINDYHNNDNPTYSN